MRVVQRGTQCQGLQPKHGTATSSQNKLGSLSCFPRQPQPPPPAALSGGSRRLERKTGDQFGSVRSVLAPPLNLAFGFEILSFQGLQLPDQSFLIVQQKAVSKTGSICHVITTCTTLLSLLSEIILISRCFREM